MTESERVMTVLPTESAGRLGESPQKSLDVTQEVGALVALSQGLAQLKAIESKKEVDANKEALKEAATAISVKPKEDSGDSSSKIVTINQEVDSSAVLANSADAINTDTAVSAKELGDLAKSLKAAASMIAKKGSTTDETALAKAVKDLSEGLADLAKAVKEVDDKKQSNANDLVSDTTTTTELKHYYGNISILLSTISSKAMDTYSFDQLVQTMDVKNNQTILDAAKAKYADLATKSTKDEAGNGNKTFWGIIAGIIGAIVVAVLVVAVPGVGAVAGASLVSALLGIAGVGAGLLVGTYMVTSAIDPDAAPHGEKASSTKLTQINNDSLATGTLVTQSNNSIQLHTQYINNLAEFCTQLANYIRSAIQDFGQSCRIQIRG